MQVLGAVTPDQAAELKAEALPTPQPAAATDSSDHLTRHVSSDPIWDAHNNEGEAAGVIDLTEATVDSVNCAYARLIKLVGPDKVVDVAQRMGIGTAPGDHSSPRKITPDLSLTLGTSPV